MAITKVGQNKLSMDATVTHNGKMYRRRGTIECQADPVTGKFETLRDLRVRAEAWIAQAKKEMRHELHIQSISNGRQDATVYMAVKRYMEKLQGQGSTARSLQTIQARLKHFTDFCDANSIVYLDQFTTTQAQAFWDWIVQVKGFVGNGAYAKFGAAHSVVLFELGREASVISRDSCTNVIKRNVKRTRDARPMSDELYEAIMSLMPSEDAYWAFALLAGGGLRKGEGQHLPVAHVLPRGFIRIAEHTDRTTGEIWYPKTDRGSRVVPENDLSTAAIDYFLAKNRGKEYLLGGDTPLSENYFIHIFERLRPRVAAKFPHLAQELLAKRPGNKRHWITPHTMRKNFASWGINAGIPRDELKDQLGHTSTYITELYSKFENPTLTATVALMNKRIPKALGPTVTVNQVPTTYN